MNTEFDSCYISEFDAHGIVELSQLGAATQIRMIRVSLHLTAAHARTRNNEALRMAAKKGHVDVLKELREGFGLTADDARARGCEALAMAAKKGHANVLKELREGYGLTAADARALDNDALRWAASKGHVGVLKELREGFGLTADDARALDNDALRAAAFSGYVEVLKELRLGFGLTADDARARQLSALMHAASNKDPAALFELRDGYGLTSKDVLDGLAAEERAGSGASVISEEIEEARIASSEALLRRVWGAPNFQRIETSRARPIAECDAGFCKILDESAAVNTDDFEEFVDLGITEKPRRLSLVGRQPLAPAFARRVCASVAGRIFRAQK